MYSKIRFNKIARLLDIIKRAKLDPLDPETKSWLDYYRSIKNLNDCSLVDELNKISPEQAMKLWDIVTEIQDMGGTLPENLLDHLYNRGVSKKQLWCEERVREKLEKPLLGLGLVLDTIGLFEGPLSSGADALSGILSMSLGNYIEAVLSFIAAYPGAGPVGMDALAKFIKYTILTAKYMSKTASGIRIGETVIDETGLREMAITALKKLEEGDVESIIPEHLQNHYQAMIGELEKIAYA